MRKVQVIVTHMDHGITYHIVDAQSGGWKVDAATRELKIGTGLPRTVIPLDNVRYYAVEEFEGE